MTEHAPNPRAAMGGNAPPLVDPDVLSAENDRVTEFANVSAEWEKKGCNSEEAASKLTDFINGARAAKAQIEAKRKAAKQPHLDAGKEVDNLFAPLDRVMELALERVRPLMDGWLKKKRAEAEKAAAEARARAEAEADTARAAQSAAQRRGDLVGYVEAQGQEKAASDALWAAQQAFRPTSRSATGGGRTMSLRTRRKVVVRLWPLAFQHVSNDPDVRAAIEKALNAIVRSKGWSGQSIPGCDVINEEYSA